MRIDIITGFPKILEGPLEESIIGLGRKKDKVVFRIHNLRDFTDDKHKTIDDYPYGGGPGMVLKVEPIVRALRDIFDDEPASEAQIILTSPRGQVLNHQLATRLSLKEHLVFICGHYKGVDERIHEFYDINEISVGDYVLSAGEIAALTIIDSVVRLLPGVIGDIGSALSDSFADELLDAPYYTRPENFEGKKVPAVLLSGNHSRIEEWRMQKKLQVTKDRRPDIFEKYNNSIK